MTFEKSSEHLRNSLIMLEIGWKSFGNRWPCFKVVKNLSTSSVNFGRRRIFDNLRKSSKIFGNSGSVEMKNLPHFTEKKLAGIETFQREVLKVNSALG